MFIVLHTDNRWEMPSRELGKVVFTAKFGYAKHLALDMVSLRCLLDILAEILIYVSED